MNYQTLYVLWIASLLICQNSLSLSVKESSKIENNVEIPSKPIEKSTQHVENSAKIDVTPLKGNILMFHNGGTTSHLIVMSALAKALLENGYKVTTVFYAKTNIVHENYDEILIEDL